MLYPVETETGSLLWICPQCGKVVRFPNYEAAMLAEQAGRCRDCRAKKTLRNHPELAWLFYDFSKRSGTKYSFWDNEQIFEDSPRGRKILS